MITPDEVLSKVNDAGRTGRFYLSCHAEQRCTERGASREDVREALRTATHVEPQANGRWCVRGGMDLDGDGLLLVVGLGPFVGVVTVLGE